MTNLQNTHKQEQSEYITRGEFVRLLFGCEPEALSGRIPAENGTFPGEEIDRKAAATLIHIYLTGELKEEDITDISPAAVLKDLYDCRVCVNHIAQVYLKGIMEACDYPELSKGGKQGEFLLFDGSKKVTEEEAQTYAARARGSLQRLQYTAK